MCSQNQNAACFAFPVDDSPFYSRIYETFCGGTPNIRDHVKVRTLNRKHQQQHSRFAQLLRPAFTPDASNPSLRRYVRPTSAALPHVSGGQIESPGFPRTETTGYFIKIPYGCIKCFSPSPGFWDLWPRTFARISSPAEEAHQG